VWSFVLSLGKNLKAALAASPKSRAEIAAEAKTTKENLSRIVTGKANPRHKLLVSIARAAGTTVAFLVAGAEHAFSPADHDEMDRHAKWLAKKQRDLDAPPNAQLIARDVSRRERRPKAPAGVTLLADRSGGDSDTPSRYRGAQMVARVLDDSMKDAGILAGDVLFGVEIERAKNIDGRIVLCRIADEIFAKRLFIEDDMFRLISESARYRPIEVARKDVELLAVVIGRVGDIPT
jgi:transcriptional regulator with XRE-family HTH domain